MRAVNREKTALWNRRGLVHFGTPCMHRVVKNAAQCLAPRGIRAPFVKRVVRLINAPLSSPLFARVGCNYVLILVWKNPRALPLPLRSINNAAMHAAKYRPVDRLSEVARAGRRCFNVSVGCDNIKRAASATARKAMCTYSVECRHPLERRFNYDLIPLNSAFSRAATFTRRSSGIDR